ncbi:MAG: nucleotidyl transferase AbiEii/AbiGii toxin family protein [Thiopseudomonas sp.]|nr:nucleotidyl transferase AbiEii/AbiGii toxin family protein [Thiopseudomonas sp.]
MSVVEQMLQKYPLTDGDNINDALREVMQEIALASLVRAGFFDKAAFYGGTCLRIFYDLPRFSEDLDFSLVQSQEDFSFEPYFDALVSEFNALGFEVEISARKKSAETAVVSAFLKKNTSIYDVQVRGQKVLKIKFEVDTEPPLGFKTEEKLLLNPYSVYVKCFSLPDLYAGKMHALLFRQWKNRVKGRDWFDFEWYVRRGAELNLAHLEVRARQSGDLGSEPLTPDLFSAWLTQRIEQLDVESAKNDVRRFIADTQLLDIWSRDYFMQLAKRVRFT